MAAKHHIGKPDIMYCATNNSSKVSASGTVRSLLKTTKINLIESTKPERVIENRGISGKSSRLYQFIVSGFGDITLRYEAEKGGTLERTVKLQEHFEPKPIEHKRAIPVPTT